MGTTANDLRINEGVPDVYDAELNVFAGFVNFGMEISKFSGNVGLRYEMDELNVNWDVNNYVGRKGSTSKNYGNILPALNLKYQVSEKSALRMAASKTITLPEFKEVSPFEYVSPEGDVFKGNPDLKRSENYNLDLKWELFPNPKDLISLSTFYKFINDPINLALTRGSSGYFKYANTGEEANVYGLEFEARMSIIKAKTTEMPSLNMVFNATKMWFNQDLLEIYQYNNKTESKLQGASEFITNASLIYSNNKEKEFTATISANYSSDKVLALGAPESQTARNELFNSEIVEKGFVTMDLIVSKKLSNRISVKLTGKNLLDPKIEQTQFIKPTVGNAHTDVVRSYKKGISFKVGVNINLN